MPRKRGRKASKLTSAKPKVTQNRSKVQLLPNQFDQTCKPSAISLKINKLELSAKGRGNDVERSILNGRYFYHFSTYNDDWKLFVFDSYYQQSFTMYDANKLREGFFHFKFNFVAYDADFGLAYDDDIIVKIQFDHEAKRLSIIDDNFILSAQPNFLNGFEIHTVEIFPQKDIVFIYASQVNSYNVRRQRVYLQRWSNLNEQFKLCKIGINDGLERVRFVSGQFVDEHRLAIVHMQDKNRPFGLIVPLVLIWDTDGEVNPDKFEKIESEDGRPFYQKLQNRTLENKSYSGAWHGNLFSLLIGRYLSKSRRFSTSMFVFNGSTKIWIPLVLPSVVKLSRSSLISFSNTGDDDTKLIFYANTDNAIPMNLFRMPVKTPDTLEEMCQLRAAQFGIFTAREQNVVVDLEIKHELKLRKENQLKVKEFQQKANQNLTTINELKKKQKKLRKRDCSGQLLPYIY